MHHFKCKINSHSGFFLHNPQILEAKFIFLGIEIVNVFSEVTYFSSHTVQISCFVHWLFSCTEKLYLVFVIWAIWYLTCHGPRPRPKITDRNDTDKLHYAYSLVRTKCEN